jgi:hypothetical protein
MITQDKIQEQLVAALQQLQEGAPEAWKALATEYEASASIGYQWSLAGVIAFGAVSLLCFVGAGLAFRASGRRTYTEATDVVMVISTVAGVMSLVATFCIGSYVMSYCQQLAAPSFHMLQELIH